MSILTGDNPFYIEEETVTEGTYDTLTRAESDVHAKGREHNIQHKAGRYAAISDKHSDYDTSKASPQGKKEFKAAHDHYVKSKAAHAEYKASNPKPPKRPTPQSDRSKESAGRYTGGKNKYTGD